MITLYIFFFFFSSRRRHTRSLRDWSSDVCSSDLEVVDVTRGKIADEMIGAAAPKLEARVDHDVLETTDLVRPEGARPIGSHLHPGPAVVIVRGGHHGDARHVEIELGEIRHRGERQADVVDLAAGGHQS